MEFKINKLKLIKLWVAFIEQLYKCSCNHSENPNNHIEVCRKPIRAPCSLVHEKNSQHYKIKFVLCFGILLYFANVIEMTVQSFPNHHSALNYYTNVAQMRENVENKAVDSACRGL